MFREIIIHFKCEAGGWSTTLEWGNNFKSGADIEFAVFIDSGCTIICLIILQLLLLVEAAKFTYIKSGSALSDIIEVVTAGSPEVWQVAKCHTLGLKMSHQPYYFISSAQQ